MAGTITVTRAAGDLKAESFGVQKGPVNLPRIGAWTADLWILGSLNMIGTVAVNFGDALELRGTVNRCKVFDGQTRLRIVAGADGLRKLAKPKHYVSPSVRQVLSDLLVDAGEVLSPTSPTDVIGETLNAWTTLALPTGIMVAALVSQVPGAAWRHLPDGTVWVGKETWPDSGFTDDTSRLIEEDPENASLLYGLDEPTLLPGTTIDGHRADIVVHTIDPEQTRTRVWTVP